MSHSTNRGIRQYGIAALAGSFSGIITSVLVGRSPIESLILGVAVGLVATFGLYIAEQS